jgi:ParB family chromosome partitioning protein
MSKKHLLEIVREDFQMPDLPDEENTQTRSRTKSLNSARIIPIQEIIPDPNQPRKTFNQQKLKELAATIRSKGVIEPVTVRFKNDQGKYMIVTGERRYKAAQIAGLTEIPCITKDLTDQEALILQIIENVQREELSPVEEAKSYRILLENNWTQTAIADLVGKSQPYISQILKMLDLPAHIIEESEREDIPKEHLLQLTRSEHPEQLWNEIRQGKTAREIRKEVEKERTPRGRPLNYRYCYRPKGKPYRVTVEFRKPHADSHEIRAALNETITFLTDMQNSESNNEVDSPPRKELQRETSIN